MAEIREIAQRYDVAVVCVLHTPEFSEYLVRVDPSYSCARIEDGKLRIVARRSDFHSEKAQQVKINDTVNMLTHFADVLVPINLGVVNALEVIEKRVKVTKTPGRMTSQDEIDN